MNKRKKQRPRRPSPWDLPPSDPRSRHVLQVVMTKNEAAAIGRAARHQGLPVSAWCRAALVPCALEALAGLNEPSK